MTLHSGVHPKSETAWESVEHESQSQKRQGLIPHRGCSPSLLSWAMSGLRFLVGYHWLKSASYISINECMVSPTNRGVDTVSYAPLTSRSRSVPREIEPVACQRFVCVSLKIWMIPRISSNIPHVDKRDWSWGGSPGSLPTRQRHHSMNVCTAGLDG